METEHVFSRHAAAEMSVAYGILVPQRRARTAARAAEGGTVTAAAIYARVSSARQAKDQTIGSQLSALRDHAGTSRLDVPEEWVFADEGHSGATLVRPGLEALRDLAAQGCLDVMLVYSPDRLARKFAYQALLIEELARCGARVEFVKGPRGDSPEDQLLIQFQGMFAEYEKAQLMERYRRGKAWRAKPAASTCSAAPRSATATSARPLSPAPATRSCRTRPRWSRRCSAATPTTAPPSPTCAAGSPPRASPPAPARSGGTGPSSGACSATPPTPAPRSSARPRSSTSRPG